MHRLVVLRIAGKPGDRAGEDQPPPPRQMRSAFAGVAAVGEGGRLVELSVEETLIGFEFERVRLNATSISDHAVSGHDSETFDAFRTGHVRGRAYTRARKC